MPDLERLANVIIAHLGSLVIKPQLCCRVRSIKSNCRACVKVCPTGAITWTRDGLEVGRCLECGLCTTACPTGALSWRQPSPEHLVAKVKELAQIYGEAYIYCTRGAPKGEIVQGIEVPCLGAVPWESWLQLMLMSTPFKVVLPENICSICSAAAGKDIWVRERDKAEALAGKDVQVIGEYPAPIRKKVACGMNKERRQLFAALVGGLGSLPEMVANKLVAGEVKEQHRVVINNHNLTGKRSLMLQVLQERPVLAEKITVRLPWVDGDCRLCAACTKLCPQGALQQSSQAGKVELTLDTVLCSGCNLCAEVCLYKALRLRDCQASELLAGVKCLVEGREFTCPDCGVVYIDTEKRKCPPCEKRVQLTLLLRR